MRSVDKPFRNTIFQRIFNTVNNRFFFFSSQFTSTFGGVDSEFFEHEENKSSSKTLDLAKGVWESNSSGNVGVEKTDNVSEVFFFNNKGL